MSPPRRATFVMACCLALAAPAAAQTRTEPGADAYREVIAEALDQYARGHYSEAHASFVKAHALFPNARTHWGLGVTAFEGRRYVEALEQLQAALVHPEKVLDTKQRAAAEDLIERSRGYVATFQIELSPADAKIVVDGVRTLDAAGARRLLLDPGEHELVASAQGYRALTRRVRAQSGDQQALSWTLERGAAGQPSASTSVESSGPAAAAERARGRSIGPYIVMGSGGAVLAGALATGLMTRSAESELIDGCSSDGSCPASLEGTLDRGKTLKTVTNVLLGVGAATVAGGLLWFVLDTPHGRETPRASLMCLQTGCSVALQGRF